MKLYEIATKYRELLDLLEDGTIDQDTFTDTMESVEGDLTDKIDNIASYVKSINYEVKALKEEEKELANRRKSKEKQVDSLMNYLETTMKSLDVSKFETSKNVVAFRKTPLAVKCLDEESVIASLEKSDYSDLVSIKVSKTLNKTLIKDYIKSGGFIDGITLEQGNKLNLK